MRVVGTRNTSGDGTAVIAAPGAGMRIVIHGIQLQAEVAGDQTILVKSGGTTVYRLFVSAKGEGLVRELSGENETDMRIYCGANEAIFVNLSASLLMNYVIDYYVDGA